MIFKNISKLKINLKVREIVAIITLLPVPRRRRTHRLRDLTGRSCLNGAALPRSEFCGPALGSSTAGCPKRSGGTRVAGSSFFWFLFFDEAKKRNSPPRDKRPAKAKTATSTKSASSADPASATRSSFQTTPKTPPANRAPTSQLAECWACIGMILINPYQ